MTKPLKYCRDRVNYWGYTILNENNTINNNNLENNNNTEIPDKNNNLDSANNNNSNNNNNNNLENFDTPSEFFFRDFKLNLVNNNDNNNNTSEFSSSSSPIELSSSDDSIESDHFIDQVTNDSYQQYLQLQQHNVNTEDKKRKQISTFIPEEDSVTGEAIKKMKIV
ncbi:hypothetical protein DICPUDRAFT_152039 [Dictyostelium purpureum]|uniref:Uncharacterized protein n=1 Tax=Dictyostelium purpureum TaxID=5786 RepID=F0ZKB5_DICPU|nr:uncharacterized protein DICPUDRAFT_152039 [Dictyostelium purpureum]EGC35628.1 hypothetical protein DICPUDRAFT_152039 [Dictyostelium purpureum]|eukprot:XP_003287865.1 hypothetical protein DICPUDRAFT_152039 [Dictyostelium purpureum]